MWGKRFILNGIYLYCAWFDRHSFENFKTFTFLLNLAQIQLIWSFYVDSGFKSFLFSFYEWIPTKKTKKQPHAKCENAWTKAPYNEKKTRKTVNYNRFWKFSYNFLLQMGHKYPVENHHMASCFMFNHNFHLFYYWTWQCPIKLSSKDGN